MSEAKTPETKSESPSPPSSAESKQSAVPASPPGNGFNEHQIAQLHALLQPIIDGQTKIENRLASLEKKTSSLEKKTSSLEKKTGLLVEQSARSMARRQFGEDFSRPFIIKSVHNLVKLIANANMTTLPKDDYRTRNAAVDKLVGLLKPLLPSFHKVAIESVNKALEDNATAFEDDCFDDAKRMFKDVAIDPINEGTELDSLEWKNIYGATLNLVAVLSKSEAQAKILKGPFKRKLERLKRAAEDKDNLDSCDCAGIMLLAAFAKAGEDVWKGNVPEQRKWIEESCNVFDFKEEVECDFTPSVSVVDKHARIAVDEIKSSMTEYSKAKIQLRYAAELLHLGLWIVIGGPFTSIVKVGHLYVFDANTDDQRFSGEVDTDMGISIFVYKAY